MSFKRILATIGAATLLAGAATIAVAAPASAHTATLKASQTCNADGGATITWKLTNDYNEKMEVTSTTNADAIPVGTTVGATTSHKTVKLTQQIPAPAAGVTETVTIDVRWHGDGYTQSNISSSITIGNGCTVPPADNASAAAAVTDAQCDAPAVLELTGEFVSWSGTEDGAVGPQPYDSTAKALTGHTFPGGHTAKHFTGTLDGPIGYQNTNPDAPCYQPENDAAASASVSTPTCTSPAVLTLTGQNVTWSGTPDGATGPQHYVSTASATQGHTFDNGETSTSFRGELAGAIGHQDTDPNAPCYNPTKDATATVSVTQPTCDEPGTASFTQKHAELVGDLDQTPGQHTATFTATIGHAFVDGTSTLTVRYTVPAASGDCIAPSLDGSTATGTCVANAPWIFYDVTLTDPDHQSTTDKAQLVLSDGTNSTTLDLGELKDGHLSGKVLWPGAAVAADGVTPTAWPGWAKDANGRYIQVPGNFAWARSVTSAEIVVNPDLTVPLSYPAATPNCDASPMQPAASVTKPSLADTGSDATVGLAAGLIALLGGAAGVGIAAFRRRRGDAKA